MKHSSALILCLAVSTVVYAAPGPGKDRQILLDVQPAAAPVPALNYQLLPEVLEMNPGNSVPAYLKCFAEQTNFFFKKESSEERERLLNCPLTDIKPGSLKDYGGSALRQADHAARLEYCDWNILPQMREQGYMMLLPEIQQMRTLAHALAVRCRGQLVDKDYDGAIRTLKTLFALSRCMGEHPTLISGLVGVAIATNACNLIEELVQQPGAPNLYWALTSMPAQLVDVRKAASAERMMTETSFGTLLDGKRAWSADDTTRAMQKLKEFASFLELSGEDRTAAETWMRERIKDEPWQTTAKKLLIDSGDTAELVAKFPPEQVFVTHLFRKARIRQDEAIKWIHVPYWQAEMAMAEMDKKPAEMEEKLARQMVFAVPKIKAAHTRLEHAGATASRRGDPPRCRNQCASCPRA